MTGAKPAKTEREKYIESKRADLAKLVAGQDFANSDIGKLIMELLAADITQFTNDILSDKYMNDHMGYVDVRAKANYASSLLNRLQSVNSPTKAKELEKEIKAAEKDADDSPVATEEVIKDA